MSVSTLAVSACSDSSQQISDIDAAVEDRLREGLGVEAAVEAIVAEAISEVRMPVSESYPVPTLRPHPTYTPFPPLPTYTSIPRSKPVEIVKEVIKMVEVPVEVAIPGETVVVEREVIKMVEIPGETVVVEREVIKTVEVLVYPSITPTPIPVVTLTPSSTPILATPGQQEGTLIGWGYGREPGRTVNLLQSTTWNKTGNPYIVTHTVRLDRGVTLTIEPGTEIVWAGSHILDSGPPKNIIFEPLESLSQVIFNGSTDFDAITVRVQDGYYDDPILAKPLFPLFNTDIPWWEEFNSTYCETFYLINVVLEDVHPPQINIHNSYEATHFNYPNLVINNSKILVNQNAALSLQPNLRFAFPAGKPFVSACKVVIDQSFLNKVSFYGWKWGDFFGLGDPNLTITNSCLLDTRFHLDLVDIPIQNTNVSRLGALYPALTNFQFRKNTVNGGFIRISGNSDNQLDLSENYWATTPEVTLSDFMVISKNEVPLNLGDPTPTATPVPLVRASINPELAKAHQDTPVCDMESLHDGPTWNVMPSPTALAPSFVTPTPFAREDSVDGMPVWQIPPSPDSIPGPVYASPTPFPTRSATPTPTVTPVTN